LKPNPEAWEWLCKNINLNNVMSLVEPRRQAVSSIPGTLDLTTGEGPTNHILSANAAATSSNSRSCKVQATTLDEALEARCPVMLKIDVEGFETAVISGARLILEKPDLRCVLMELAGYGKRYGFDENVLRHQMAELGFRSCKYDPFSRSLQSEENKTASENTLKTASENTLKTASENTLFVRGLEFARQRVESAPPFTVRGWTI
jgi:FkbM family methyltransferase